jgi:hypothetical protein
VYFLYNRHCIADEKIGNGFLVVFISAILIFLMEVLMFFCTCFFTGAVCIFSVFTNESYFDTPIEFLSWFNTEITGAGRYLPKAVAQKALL